MTDPSLLSLEHTEGENKGRKRRIREGGGFKVGDGPTEQTHGVKTHISLHGYT